MWCTVWTHQKAFVFLTKGQSTGLQIIQVRDCRPTPNRVQSLIVIPCHTAESLCFPDKRTVYRSTNNTSQGLQTNTNRVQSLLPCHTADSLCFPDKWEVYLHIYLCKSGMADQHPIDYSHDRRTWPTPIRVQFKIPCSVRVESLCFSGNALNIIQIEHCRPTPNRVQSLVPHHTSDSLLFSWQSTICQNQWSH